MPKDLSNEKAFVEITNEASKQVDKTAKRASDEIDFVSGETLKQI